MTIRLKGRSALPTVANGQPTERASMSLLGIGSLIMLSVGVVAGNPFVAGIGALMAGLLILLRLVGDLHGGVTSSNWGTWRRQQNPVGFRCNISFWIAVTVSLFVLGLLTMFEWLHQPAA